MTYSHGTVKKFYYGLYTRTPVEFEGKWYQPIMQEVCLENGIVVNHFTVEQVATPSKCDDAVMPSSPRIGEKFINAAGVEFVYDGNKWREVQVFGIAPLDRLAQSCPVPPNAAFAMDSEQMRQAVEGIAPYFHPIPPEDLPMARLELDKGHIQRQIDTLIADNLNAALILRMSQLLRLSPEDTADWLIAKIAAFRGCGENEIAEEIEVER
jgi:hypothetical protein